MRYHLSSLALAAAITFVTYPAIAQPGQDVAVLEKPPKRLHYQKLSGARWGLLRVIVMAMAIPVPMERDKFQSLHFMLVKCPSP